MTNAPTVSLWPGSKPLDTIERIELSGKKVLPFVEKLKEVVKSDHQMRAVCRVEQGKQ